MARQELRELIYTFIDTERERQDARWGDTDFFDPCVNAAVLGEEMGEVCKAVIERDVDGLHEELTQLAAVCVKWLERLGQGQTGVRP